MRNPTDDDSRRDKRVVRLRTEWMPYTASRPQIGASRSSAKEGCSWLRNRRDPGCATRCHSRVTRPAVLRARCTADARACGRGCLHRDHRRRDLLLPAGPHSRHLARAHSAPRRTTRSSAPTRRRSWASVRSRSSRRSASTRSTGCASSSSTSGAWAPRYQRLMFWIVIVLWIVLLAGFFPRHLSHVFGGE